MGCNSSKAIYAANGSNSSSNNNNNNNRDGWNIPLVRSLSRSWSMPYYKPMPSSLTPEHSHSFHVVALTSSTYGVLEDKSSRIEQQFFGDRDEEDEDGPGEVINPSPNKSFLKKGSSHKSSDRVRVPEVIDVWDLMEDLNSDNNMSKLSLKRRKRARTYSKSASMPHISKPSSSEFEQVHGLPLVLEEKKSPRSLLSTGSYTFLKTESPSSEKEKSNTTCRRPPLAPSSRKGLFYGASLVNNKQDAAADSASSKNKFVGHRISLASEQEGIGSSSRRSSFGGGSGYCTPCEHLDCLSPSSSASSSSGPPSPAYSALDDEGWYMVNNSNSRAALGAAAAAGFKQGEDEVCGMKRIGVCLRDKTNIRGYAPNTKAEEKKISSSLLDGFEVKCPPGGEGRVVLYFTSLQGIRKTYEQCRNVKMVLEGMFARIDERDVSMHGEFRQELRELLGAGCTGVPRLFIKGRYIGGAEEVMQLNENGILRQLLEGTPREVMKKACEGCGGMRFIPCMECSGSCKVVGADDQVVRCWDCNENGLVRCPICY